MVRRSSAIRNRLLILRWSP